LPQGVVWVLGPFPCWRSVHSPRPFRTSSLSFRIK
jgi:hypothetical protein